MHILINKTINFISLDVLYPKLADKTSDDKLGYMGKASHVVILTFKCGEDLPEVLNHLPILGGIIKHEAEYLDMYR